MTTPILSAGASNRNFASIISRALFISVAESTVILGPIFQFGCRSASRGVIREKAPARLKNGPPDAVRRIFRTLSGLSPAMTWKIAFVSAAAGKSRAAAFLGGAPEKPAGADQRFLVGNGQRDAAFGGGERRRQARRAHHPRQENVPPRVLP